MYVNFQSEDPKLKFFNNSVNTCQINKDTLEEFIFDEEEAPTPNINPIQFQEEFKYENTILMKNFNPNISVHQLENFFKSVSKIKRICCFFDKYNSTLKLLHIEFFTPEQKNLARSLNHFMLDDTQIKIEDKMEISSSWKQIVINFSNIYSYRGLIINNNSSINGFKPY